MSRGENLQLSIKSEKIAYNGKHAQWSYVSQLTYIGHVTYLRFHNGLQRNAVDKHRYIWHHLSC